MCRLIQLRIELSQDDVIDNARTIKKELDNMPTPMPRRIDVTQREVDQFTTQAYQEYQTVWGMPEPIRTRIRALRANAILSSERRRAETHPRLCNTGVTSR